MKIQVYWYLHISQAVISLLKVLQQKMQPINSNNITGTFIPQTDMLAFVNCDGAHFFNAMQIIRCEASSNYTRFHFNDQKILLIAKTLGEYEASLPPKLFLRIHRSEIINISHVRKYDKLGNLWLSDGTCLTVAKRRKAKVIRALRSFIL